MTLRIIGDRDAPAPGASGRSFAAVYRAELPYVFATLRRLGVPEKDFEDLAQEVFVIFHRRLADLDPERPVRPWLFGMARRVAANHRRSAPVRREVAIEALPAGHMPPAVTEPPAHAERDLLSRALDTLDFDRRSIIVMHDIDGFSVAEIAEVFEMKLDTLYSHLRRARRQLAEAVHALESGRAPRTGAAPTTDKP